MVKLFSFWTSLFSLISSFTLLTAYLTRGEATFNTTHFLLFDNFSIIFIFLISLIYFLIVLWLREKQNIQKKFFVSLLIFQFLAISSALTSDIFLLFVFIESSIIPLYIMLNSSQKKENLEAVLNFIIYSLLSSLLILIALIMIYFETKTSNLTQIYSIEIKNSIIFWILFIGIAIKIPVWPFYYWLPIVHVKSSTECSIIFASIVLKFSALLIIRLILPIFSEFLHIYNDILFIFFSLSIFSAISQAICQKDLKKIFAYFSIVHMNMACVILLGDAPKIDFIFGILSHSLVIAFLFFIIDAIEIAFQSRSIADLKDSQIFSKKIKFLFFAGILSLMGVPGSSGFVFETLCLCSVAKTSIFYLYILCAAILFSSLFLFRTYWSIFSNNAANIAIEDSKILAMPEKFVLYITLLFIAILGIFPKLILNFFSS